MNYGSGRIQTSIIYALATLALATVLGACGAPFPTSPIPSEALTQGPQEIPTSEPSPVPTPAVTPTPIPSPMSAPTPTPEPTNPPTTIPTPSATEPAPVQSPAQVDALDIVSITSPVSRNEKATLKAKGKPDTEYKISVYYSSGVSKAAGLEKKNADADGNVSWTWKIGGSTKIGNYKIEVTGGGETKTVYFDVV